MLVSPFQVSMEDEDLSSSNPRETLTTTTKHDAMLERLANRHQTRLKNSATRRDAESDSSDSPSFESTDSFLSRFTELSRAAECRISRCRIAQPDIVKAELAGIADSISDLEKLVAENSYFLPSYEVRSSLRAVSDLRQSLEVLSSKLLPKKKFSFKSKASKKETSQRIKESEAPEAERINFSVPESPGFRGKTGELLVKKFDGSEIGEFTISDLDSCEVRLIGCVRALFVHRLRNCRIYGGPVTASILIEGAENCIFVVASHQIRIHHAKGTDFYLRVRSRPIIEDSEKVRFAPYHLSYEGLEEDLKNAGLEEETGNWANVDDFRWLRAVQSPNWSVLPESERLGLIKISDSVLNRDEKI